MGKNNLMQKEIFYTLSKEEKIDYLISKVKENLDVLEDKGLNKMYDKFYKDSKKINFLKKLLKKVDDWDA